MRVLIACEFSGTVRDAFAARGHDAWSCDLLPSEKPGQHIQGDCREILGDGWDCVIGHPPCTHLSVSGAKWFAEKKKDGRQRDALQFFLALLNAPIPMICLENPVSIASSHIRPADQLIHPWQFGHAEEKTTCLWLKNLPPLKPTKIVKPEGIVYQSKSKKKGFSVYPKIHTTKKHPNKLYHLPPSEERWKLRSVTFQGIADAMAAQWDRIFPTKGFGFGGPHQLIK